MCLETIFNMIYLKHQTCSACGGALGHIKVGTAGNWTKLDGGISMPEVQEVLQSRYLMLRRIQEVFLTDLIYGCHRH